MGELEEKLENILGNPQAMAQIMSLAQSLNLGGSGEGGAGQVQGPEQVHAQPQEQVQAQPQEQVQTAPAPSGDAAPASPAGPAPSGGGLEGQLIYTERFL